MKKSLLLLLIVLVNVLPCEQKRRLTRYEIGKEMIDRVYSLALGTILGGVSYQLGSYAYTTYKNNNHTNYIDRAINEVLKIKNKFFGPSEKPLATTVEPNYEQLFIIPAALLSLSCGFYALNAINKALFYQEYEATFTEDEIEIE